MPYRPFPRDTRSGITGQVERDGLVRMLEAYDFEILAAVESGPELTKALAELEPDIAVVDVRLPPSHTD